MNVYLDNAATTRCLPEAADIMKKVMLCDYGNPSSLHTMGMDAEGYIREARRVIAGSLKAKEKEIIFTSGGTESNNLALFGAARAKKRAGGHIITTMIEHPSVNNPVSALEKEGYEVTYLPVDKTGVISLDMLRESIREDTILVSIMHVNNEIGAIEPIAEAARIVHEKNNKCLFHVDAIQSYGKIDLYPARMGLDLVSVSGHKLHGPKGSGFLYVREGTRILPILYGGGQESTLRSGTENVPAIAGLSAAVSNMFSDSGAHRAHLHELKKEFTGQIRDIEGITVNGPLGENGAPHIASVTCDGVKAEVLLHALEDKGVYISAGSACSSNRPHRSRTLMAIGADAKRLDSTVRFSFSIYNTLEEVEYAADALAETVVLLRRFARR